MKKNRDIKLVLILLFLGIGFSGFSQNTEIPLWDKIPDAIAVADYKEEMTYFNDGSINGISKVS